VGKRDFTEITPREVVPYKVSSPGGVIVDRSVQPGRAYVWDSGNSRILGLDLAQCYAQPSPCDASIVIGQPSASDHGACNLDSSYQYYPQRAPASAATLCGIWEGTHTTLEDKSFANMEVDSAGNLYVPDSRNNRVLEYLSPFTTDVVADEVWGQADFTGNECNASASSPTAATLCFHSIGSSGSGVALDGAGNLWVADGGNNRVLRFPRLAGGAISRTADLVLGQPDFTTGGDWSFGDAMDRMHAPAAVRLDGTGNLYVADSGNQRVLVFRPPFTSGMNAGKTLGSAFSGGPLGLEIDPSGRGLWTFDNEGWDGEVQLWGFDGTLQATLPLLGNPGGGSIGIDADGGVLASVYVYGQDVYRHSPSGTGYVRDKALFSPPFGYNLTTSRRLEHSAWMGVAIAANQLVVADGRLLFWNDPLSLVNGQAADGYLGASSFTELPDPGFGQVKSDLDDRVWVTKRTEVRLYQAPLSSGAAPLRVLQSPLPALGGGQLEFSDVHGLAPTPHSEFLWLSEPGRHRVFRVRDPLSDSPLVDVVLGQTALDGDQCNRGLVPAPNQNPGRPPAEDAALDMLCFPGALALDRSGNLYVSDHFLEVEGNWRLLMFSSSLFPPAPSSILFAPAATKEFPRSGPTNATPHLTFEPAFDSTNRMVVGLNPYSGRRFVDYYDDPTALNPADPRDPDYARPDGQLRDFYGWPVAVTFDSSDNLFVLDANRGKVLIYRGPLGTAPPSGVILDSATTAAAEADLLTWQHTVSGSQPLLLLGASIRGNAPIDSVTYAGIPLAKIRHDSVSSGPFSDDVRSELWFLAAPPTGTHTVEVRLAFPQNIIAGAMSFRNVDPTAPLGSDAGATHDGNAGTTAAVQVPSGPGELVVDVVATQAAGATVTAGPLQTPLWNRQGDHGNGGSSSQPGRATTTMSWTLAYPEFWAISAVALREVSATGDFIAPKLVSFDVQPRATYGAIAASWEAADEGGSHLKQVELWRAAYDGQVCHEGDHGGCVWTRVSVVTAPSGLDVWSGSTSDLPAPDGVYWYGLRVRDNFENETTEASLSGPVKMIKLRPPTPETSPTLTRKALVVIYDPVLSDGRKLHEARGWNDPRALVPPILDSLRQSSAGYLDYQIVATEERNEWPLKMDGFRYDEASYLGCIDSPEPAVDCHFPDDMDYARVFSDLGICGRVAAGEVDEVILYGAPYFGFDELAFKIPGDVMPYNTPTNYWLYEGRKKNIPDCGKTVWVMGYSYERGLAEALESYGHRIESALALTVGRGYWDGCPGHPTLGPSDFDHFTCIDKDTAGAPVAVAGCGNGHFPPNGQSDWDYGNRTLVPDACLSWDDYPFDSKTVVSHNCTTWGCEGLTYLLWWMSHLPNREGETANANLRNWWKYVADFDNAVASLARADLEVSGIDFTSPPTAGVLTTAVARLVNVGAASSGVFNVKWFLDGVEVGYGGHLSLAPGEVSNDNIRFDWVPTPGVHSLRFDADADNQVAELNEQNNSATVTARVLADLEARGIIFTSSVREGVRTTAVAVLANVGRAPSGVFNVKWFLDGAQVGYGGHVSLAPGEISNDNIRFDWTPTRGTHTLRFEADVDDQVPELNEGNNSATVTARVLADLEVGRITFSSPPTVGAWTGVEARLANVGRAPSGSFKVRWWLDGQEHLTVTYPNGLDPGQRTLDGFNWTPTAGVHTLRFEADVDDQVPELNEGNNSATVTVRVLADLEVSGITFTSTPRVGVRTTAVARLANVGRASSGVFNVKWFLDGVQVGYGSHASLAPGEVSTGNVRFGWTPTPGRHRLRFQADVDNQVRELNERNNDATVTVQVR
jgi:hypothetical protein